MRLSPALLEGEFWKVGENRQFIEPLDGRADHVEELDGGESLGFVLPFRGVFSDQNDWS